MKKTGRIIINIVLVMLLAFVISGCAKETAVTEESTEAAAIREEQNTSAENEAASRETGVEEQTDIASLEKNEIYEILCYGDSNTYGFDPNTGGRYPDEVLWTTQLEQKLGEGYKVINEGLNGRTTSYDVPGAEGLNGLTAFQEYISGHRTADMIIFMLGTNDLFIPGITAEEVMSGMEGLILEIKELSGVSCGWDPELVIVVPPEINADMFEQIYAYRPEEQEAISHQLVDLYKELAEKYDMMYLNASELLELSEIDGVHITENAHRAMAERLYELISDASDQSSK